MPVPSVDGLRSKRNLYTLLVEMHLGKLVDSWLAGTSLQWNSVGSTKESAVDSQKNLDETQRPRAE